MSNLNPSSRKAYGLVRAVAAIYRTNGAKVEEEVSLAGNRVDLVAWVPTLQGNRIRYAVECKAYSKLVGLRTVRIFHSLAVLLIQRNLIDKAVLVSVNGFTKAAQNYAKSQQLELLTLFELQTRVRGREEEVLKEVESGFEGEQRAYAARPKIQRVFVVMPFAKKFDDLYVIGIREVAENLGLVVERADDIEHNNQILEVIQQKIKDCDLVVAEISSENANVYYEVGYAHALGKPTILLLERGHRAPFDLQSFNQVVYDSLVDLRKKLEKRMRYTLSL